MVVVVVAVMMLISEFRNGDRVVCPPYALEHPFLDGISADGTLCRLGDIRELEIMQDARIAEYLFRRQVISI